MNSSNLDALLRNESNSLPPSVPFQVSSRIELTLRSLPDKTVLAKIRNRRLKRISFFAASIIVIVGAVGGYSVLHPNESSSQNATMEATAGNNQASQSSIQRTTLVETLHPEQSKESPGVSVTDHGIKMTVKDIKYDGTVLQFHYTLETPNDFELKVNDVQAELKTDGLSRGKWNGQKGNITQYSIDLQKVKPGVYEGEVSHVLGDYRPGSFDMTFQVTKIGTERGKWTIDIPVEKTSNIVKLEPSIKKEKIEAGIDTVEGFSTLIDLQSITLTPLSTTLRFKYEFRFNLYSDRVLGVEVTDNNGVFYGSALIGGTVKGATILSSGTSVDIHKPILKGAKQLIVKPYLYDAESQKEPIYFDSQKPRPFVPELEMRIDLPQP